MDLTGVAARTWVAFGALTASALLLWAPAWSRRVHARWWWVVPFAAALLAAVSGGLVEAPGLGVLGVLAAAAYVTGRPHTSRPVAIVAHVVVIGLCALLFVHAAPGFHNPRVLDGVRLAADAEPYTKYLNIDKGAASVLVLGLYARTLTADDHGWRHARGTVWRVALVVAAVMALSVAMGFVRWDPKLPAWWPLWGWSMLLLTALPEEALFRGVMQQGLAGWLGIGDRAAVVAAGLLFGAAHAAGGAAYALLASAAGIGYGWVYWRSRSIASAALAHTALNTVHLLFFTYPALTQA